MLLFLQVLVGSARNMYNCCVEGMNFEEFFEGKTVIFLSVKQVISACDGYVTALHTTRHNHRAVLCSRGAQVLRNTYYMPEC